MRRIHDEVFQHPSQVVVRFSRAQGTPRRLVGSNVSQRHTIHLEVSWAKRYRDDTAQTDSYLEMSELQFAELITTLNIGSGVPGTLNWMVGKGRIEEPPVDEMKERTDRQLREELMVVEGLVADLRKEADEILDKKNLLASDRKRLAEILRRISMELNSNLPYVRKCFQRSIDRTLNDAKADIDHWLSKVASRVEGRELEPPMVDIPMLSEGDGE